MNQTANRDATDRLADRPFLPAVPGPRGRMEIHFSRTHLAYEYMLCSIARLECFQQDTGLDVCQEICRQERWFENCSFEVCQTCCCRPGNLATCLRLGCVWLRMAAYRIPWMLGEPHRTALITRTGLRTCFSREFSTTLPVGFFSIGNTGGDNGPVGSGR